MAFAFEKLIVYQKSIEFADTISSTPNSSLAATASRRPAQQSRPVYSGPTLQKAMGGSPPPIERTSLELLAVLFRNAYHYTSWHAADCWTEALMPRPGEPAAEQPEPRMGLASLLTAKGYLEVRLARLNSGQLEVVWLDDNQNNQGRRAGLWLPGDLPGYGGSPDSTNRMLRYLRVH
jgi:hypothetical protein